jgi:putative transposase
MASVEHRACRRVSTTGTAAGVVIARAHAVATRSLRQRTRTVLDTLPSPRFVDSAPAPVYATLLDEGTYLASERTMYRVLADAGEVRELRDQLRRPNYTKPELLATAPNELWSWDTPPGKVGAAAKLGSGE